MFKYEMSINNVAYAALFLSVQEFLDFSAEVLADGDKLELWRVTPISFKEAMRDPKLEEDYVVEVMTKYVFPQNQFEKVSQCYDFLKSVSIL